MPIDQVVADENNNKEEKLDDFFSILTLLEQTYSRQRQASSSVFTSIYLAKDGRTVCLSDEKKEEKSRNGLFHRGQQ